jgi:hypothetical protein
MVLFTTFVQTKFRPCKLNLDRTFYTVFRNIRYSSKSSNVLNTVFSKQNIMHSASAVDIYRAQRKHINYSIWPMRISRHDLRRRYSNSLVIDAGSEFTLRACSQARKNITYILSDYGKESASWRIEVSKGGCVSPRLASTVCSHFSDSVALM